MLINFIRLIADEIMNVEKSMLLLTPILRPYWILPFILSLCFAASLAAEEVSYFTLPDTSEIPILTPALFDRETSKIRLNNGLEAYIVSDPGIVQAGAVLTVQAGSWDDPEQYPGLAHFLEHMLFLGTEKYPIESDYDRFIHAHHGNENAYTAPDYTLYLFSIDASAFEEALDRFSFFFKKPLFHPSGVSRELNAVNQEFIKNLDQNFFRENLILKELANPAHPFSHFSIGNIDTLSEVTQEVLREWYQKHYSAQSMRLIVYGPQPLETLIDWVVRDFQAIPSHETTAPKTPLPLFEEGIGEKLIHIEPINGAKILHLTWDIPIPHPAPSSFRPASFITTLLGYEGEGSLLSLLKERGWAEGLTASDTRLSRDHLLFSLEIELSDKGLEEVYEVVECALQVIRTLQEMDSFPPHLFEELQTMSRIHYQYQSRMGVYQTLMRLGELLVYEKFDRFPESAFVPEAFDAEAVQAFLSELTPQKLLAVLIAEDSEALWDHKEKWSGTRYRLREIPKRQIDASDQLLPFHLPLPNLFIPEEIGLGSAPLCQEEGEDVRLPRPQLLVETEHAAVYFAEDTHFRLPQTLWFFEIKTPSIDSSQPIQLMLTRLYLEQLQKGLRAHAYPAQMAGLFYDLSQTVNGVSLTLSGHPEGVEKLFDLILEQLAQAPPSEEEFERLKDSILALYRSSGPNDALNEGMNIYRSLLYDPFTSYRERLKALNTLSYPLFLTYLQHLYDDTYIEGLCYGAITRDRALNAYRKLEALLDSRPFPRWQHKKERIVVLPEQSGPYLLEAAVPFQSHAAILVIEGEGFSVKKRAAQQILTQALNSAFYSTLRTQQQTGYLLFVKGEEVDQHLFNLFAVQSATHDPRDLLARFELFIESFLEEMERGELQQADFEHIRESLLHSLEHYPQNVGEAGRLLHRLAFEHEGHFDWLEERIQGFRELTYEEFLSIAREWLGKRNKRRLAILVRGDTDADLHYEPLSGLQALRAASRYTRVQEQDAA